MNGDMGEAAVSESGGTPSRTSEPEPTPKSRKQLPQRSVDVFWEKVGFHVCL